MLAVSLTLVGCPGQPPSRADLGQPDRGLDAPSADLIRPKPDAAAPRGCQKMVRGITVSGPTPRVRVDELGAKAAEQENYWGLFRSDGKKKPAWQAMKAALSAP